MFVPILLLALNFLLLLAVWLIAAATGGDIVLPGWLLMSMPAINTVATWVVIKTRSDDKLDANEKRNINRAVSIVLFTGLALTGQVTAPEAMPDVPLIGAWVPYALAYLGWIWQGSQVVHDLLDVFKVTMPSPA